MNPIKQFNQYSCALASVVFEATKSGRSVTQESIIADFTSHFPLWQTHPGLMEPPDILHLLTLLEMKASDFIATKNIEEGRAFLVKRSSYASFVWIRKKPRSDGEMIENNHCMVLRRFKEDGGIEAMDPAIAQTISIASSDFEKMDGTILLCTTDAQNRNR